MTGFSIANNEETCQTYLQHRNKIYNGIRKSGLSIVRLNNELIAFAVKQFFIKLDGDIFSFSGH